MSHLGRILKFRENQALWQQILSPDWFFLPHKVLISTQMTKQWEKKFDPLATEPLYLVLIPT